jgi:adenine-specific DNA-methyltransferase
MVTWIIRSKVDTLLEPSFGACGFLIAACLRLKHLGCSHPLGQAAGCDTDPAAFRVLATLEHPPPPPKHFLKRDFLTVSPADFAIGNFSCLLSNPPFTRHHRIPPETKKALARNTVSNGVRLAKTAGLWAHFLVHCLSFMQPHSRIGVILPTSFLFADYAEPLRILIRTRFARSLIIRLTYPAFASQEAQERGLIVLAEDFGCHSGSCTKTQRAASELEAVRAVSSFDAETTKPGMRRGFRADPQRGAYEFLSRTPVSQTLGELARFDIGVVTGANKTFVITQKIVEEWGLPADALKPIIARTSHLPGLCFTSRDHTELLSRGAPVWLFTPSQLGERHGPVRRYLSQVSRVDRRSILWFKKRERWFSPSAGEDPDAVITYMNGKGPKLALLTTSATCTNTLHRVWFRRDRRVNRGLVSLSLISSYSQLFAELIGRSYGGGVLKIEPKASRAIRVVLPDNVSENDTHLLFDECDGLIRLGSFEDATALVDDFLLKPIFGAAWFSYRSELRDALCEARSLRGGPSTA